MVLSSENVRSSGLQSVRNQMAVMCPVAYDIYMQIKKLQVGLRSVLDGGRPMAHAISISYFFEYYIKESRILYAPETLQQIRSEYMPKLCYPRCDPC